MYVYLYLHIKNETLVPTALHGLKKHLPSAHVHSALSISVDIQNTT